MKIVRVPSENGWYWFRNNGSLACEVVEVIGLEFRDAFGVTHPIRVDSGLFGGPIEPPRDFFNE